MVAMTVVVSEQHAQRRVRHDTPSFAASRGVPVTQTLLVEPRHTLGHGFEQGRVRRQFRQAGAECRVTVAGCSALIWWRYWQHPPDEGGHQRSSEVISGQHPPDEGGIRGRISGHQRSSEVIRGHQWSSVVMTGSTHLAPWVRDCSNLQRAPSTWGSSISAIRHPILQYPSSAQRSVR